MPRVTLYVPDDLQRAMSTRSNVNWSAVFQQAVQAELNKPIRDIIVLGKNQHPEAPIILNPRSLNP